MAPIKTEKFEKVQVESQSELREWLNKNHYKQESVWLVTFKKVVPEKYLSTDQVLDELVAFGWIDGIRRKLDDERTMQLISQRKTQYWAKSYKDRVERLAKEGKMDEAGLKKIEESKANGLWDFMDDVDALIIPADLSKELESYKSASQNFENFSDSVKRNILRWIKLAKTNKTRQKRIQKIASEAERGIAIKPNG